MIKRTIIPVLIMLTSCSTFKQEFVDCPKLTALKSAAEIVTKSDKILPVYIGIRGVQSYCSKASNGIEMDISVNIRAIRNDITEEDYAPVRISIVSVDKNDKEYDRDDFSYSQFLLKGSRIVDRKTEMNLVVPDDGMVYLGIK